MQCNQLHNNNAITSSKANSGSMVLLKHCFRNMHVAIAQSRENIFVIQGCATCACGVAAGERDQNDNSLQRPMHAIIANQSQRELAQRVKVGGGKKPGNKIYEDSTRLSAPKHFLA